MITFDDYTEFYKDKLITISITHHHGGARRVTGCVNAQIVIREDNSSRNKEELIEDMRALV